jgi:hypothetical protein
MLGFQVSSCYLLRRRLLPLSEFDGCAKSLRSSYTGLHPQRERHQAELDGCVKSLRTCYTGLCPRKERGLAEADDGS